MKVQRIFIQQRIQMMEAFTGCQFNNQYDIFNYRNKKKEKKAKSKKKGYPLWHVTQEAECCERNCLPARCREGTIEIYNVTNGEEDFVALELRKEFSCSMICLNPPTMKLYYVENG